MPEYLTQQEEEQAVAIENWLEECDAYREQMTEHISNARSGQNPLTPLPIRPIRPNLVDADVTE